ncbi:hypothetical protein LIER_16987 [Lithospermum erythrorhizon]|uniref:Uncharacterized protein n=1 Tax=Lithospermum erythrorhizon TaxID=34254 RepID=A0AAV3Q8Y9_LITER
MSEGKQNSLSTNKPSNLENQLHIQTSTSSKLIDGGGLQVAPFRVPPEGEKEKLKERRSKAWVEIAKKYREKRINLTFIPPDVVDGKPMVKYCSADMIQGVSLVEQWRSRGSWGVDFKVSSEVRGSQMCYKGRYNEGL